MFSVGPEVKRLEKVRAFIRRFS